MPNDRTLFMIGNAHIDPVWLWRWPDGFSEVKATFRSALDRMEEYGDFVFTCGCSLYYRWVEENEPEMFEEIRCRVREGRWVLVGGWLIQPDCNMPAGESFARQSLYGQRYFLSRFGRCARVGYNVDSFGHSAMLPQILKKSGMDAYVMMRPHAHELSLPDCRFRWRSPDGSEVLAFRIPTCYNNAEYTGGEEDPFLARHSRFTELTQGMTGPLMEFYGVGNHGGGPTRQNLDTLHALQESEAGIVLSSPDAFFDALRRAQLPLPVVEGELQHHASGCYSARMQTKQGNRRAEQALLEAESLAALCARLAPDGRDARGALYGAWEKVLFNQFHDVMGGCCIRPAYGDADDQIGYACTVAGEEANHAAQRIAWHIDTMGRPRFPLSKDTDGVLWEAAGLGAPVVVFNTLAHEVTAPVQIDRALAGVTDETGAPVAVQHVRALRGNMKNNLQDTVFLAAVPPMGYRVYRCFQRRAFEAPRTAVRADASALSMENGLVRVTFDAKTGAIREWLDLTAGRALFRGPAALPVVLDESGADTWGHDVYAWDRQIGAFGAARVRVLESGPVRARVRVESSFGRSTLRQDFFLYAGRSALEAEGCVVWHERNRMLRLCFPLDAENPRAFYQIPYGVLERPANGLEEPCQQWMDVCGTAPGGAGTGAALLNTGCQSGCVRGATLGLTVLCSPLYAELGASFGGEAGRHDEDADCMEQGERFFSYTVLPHAFDGTAAHAALLTREAAARNRPPRVCRETFHPGPLGQRFSGLAVTQGSAEVDAFKRAEDGGAFVLRLHETAGRACEARVEIPLLGRSLTLSLGPQEIRTLLLPDDESAPAQEADLLERPL